MFFSNLYFKGETKSCIVFSRDTDTVDQQVFSMLDVLQGWEKTVILRTGRKLVNCKIIQAVESTEDCAKCSADTWFKCFPSPDSPRKLLFVWGQQHEETYYFWMRGPAGKRLHIRGGGDLKDSAGWDWFGKSFQYFQGGKGRCCSLKTLDKNLCGGKVRSCLMLSLLFLNKPVTGAPW